MASRIYKKLENCPPPQKKKSEWTTLYIHISTFIMALFKIKMKPSSRKFYGHLQKKIKSSFTNQPYGQCIQKGIVIPGEILFFGYDF